MLYDSAKLKGSRWCLLEDGRIEPTRCGNRLRDFQEDEDGELVLFHDVWTGFGVAYCSSKVVKLAKRREDLEPEAEGLKEKAKKRKRK